MKKVFLEKTQNVFRRAIWREMVFGPFLFAIALISGPDARAASDQTERTFTIFQTADIHSHFDNRGSEHKLGGVARLKTLIDFLKKETPNSILLDAGDWSEGTLFFTLGNGIASQQVMDALHYDAITLGNHDWLIGPQDLAQSFANSHMKTQVLSANLNFNGLAGTIPLRNFIRPYKVMTVNGVRVGVFGLSTFQLIYDSYFQPVTLQEPFAVAAILASYLKDVEGCDVVIALSHMGVEFDRVLAQSVTNIDVIAGGHSHKLFYQPQIINGVTINHVGKWGEYVGEMQIGVPGNGKRPYLKAARLNAVNENIPEDPQVAKMVAGYQAEIEKNFNEPMFQDIVLNSQVHDHVMDMMQDEPVGNWAIDAVRASAGADIAVDHSRYVQQNLLPGKVTSADVFNIWPHLFTSETQKAWTIHTFNLPGALLNLMMQAFFRIGGGLKMSNVRVVVDYSAKILPLKSIVIGDQPIDDFKIYKVAAPGGITDAFNFLDQKLGTKLGVTQMTDTGVESWRVIRAKLHAIANLTPLTGAWQGRIRSLQPDLYLPYEQLVSWHSPQSVGGRFEIINVGMSQAQVLGVRIKLHISSDGGVTKSWEHYPEAQYNFTTLGAGKNREIRFQDETPVLKKGEHLYATILARRAPGELHFENNQIEALLY